MLRKKANELEEREKNFELEKQRQLDEERAKIRQQTAESLLKEHQMRDAEKNKQMEDMKRKIEELQQKANLTSQQLQGEVQELELDLLFGPGSLLERLIGIEGDVELLTDLDGHRRSVDDGVIEVGPD